MSWIDVEKYIPGTAVKKALVKLSNGEFAFWTKGTDILGPFIAEDGKTQVAVVQWCEL